MGWDTTFCMQVHGPFSEVIKFQHQHYLPFQGDGYLSWMPNESYERIISPYDSLSFPSWECLRDEKGINELFEKEEKEKQLPYNKFRSPSQPIILELSPRDPPSLLSLVARTIADKINDFEDSLHLLPEKCLYLIFSQSSSYNLIRLRFERQELNDKLHSLLKECTFVLFYLFEYRKGCYNRINDFLNFTRENTHTCMHLALWDDCNCNHYDTRSCITKGEMLWERALYMEVNPSRVLDITRTGNRAFLMDVCEEDYFRDVDPDILHIISEELEAEIRENRYNQKCNSDVDIAIVQ